MMDRTFLHRLVAIAGLLPATISLADRFDVAVDASSASVQFEFTVPFSGTLIGDQDPKSNPDGTQTRRGLFGGSGNNPIPCELDLSIASSGEPSSPGGTIDLDFADVASSLLGIQSLELDLLGDAVETVDAGLVIVYDTFNTVNPFSIYPGGIEIPVPLAGAQVLRSEISLPEPTTVFVDGSDGTVRFDTIVPAVWTIEFDAGTGAQIQEVPIALPFAGAITGSPGSRSLEVGGAAANAGDEPLDVPVGPIPVPLPTIPPGGTANLLFSGALTSVAFSTDLAFSIRAEEVAAPLAGDLDGDGRVGSSDLGIMISLWGPCPGCPADLTFDGMVDAADLGALFVAWSF